MLLLWLVLCVHPPAKSPWAVRGTLAPTAGEWLQWAPEAHEWPQNLNQAHFVPPFLPMLSSADVPLKQPQSTKTRWGKWRLMWLSPLESVRLNTECFGQSKLPCPLGLILPLLKSKGTLSDFADCCESLSEVRISAFILMLWGWQDGSLLKPYSSLTVKDSTSLDLVYSMNRESRDLCITISPHWLISKWE